MSAGAGKKRRRVSSEQQQPSCAASCTQPTDGAIGSAAAEAPEAAGNGAAEESAAGNASIFPGLTCPACSACGATPGSRHPPHRSSTYKDAVGASNSAAGVTRKQCRELRRCCYCREAVYCSQDCIVAHAEMHKEMHAMRFIFFEKRQLKFDNIVDFAPLSLD